LPGETPKKEKSYFEKKREREDHESKHMTEANSILQKIHDEKRIRKEFKNKMRKDKKCESVKRIELKSKMKEDQERKEIDEKRKDIQEKMYKIREDRENAIK
jgi:hypothetical protein